jgi:hypothetical protein
MPRHDYDLSGDVYESTLEVFAFNVMRLVEYDREQTGSPASPVAPMGLEDFLNRAIMYLAAYHRLRNEEKHDTP